MIHPALQAFVTAFEPVVHVKKTFEADTEPTMHKALPMLERRQQQLMSRSDESIHKLGQKVGLSTVKERRKIEEHPI